MTTTDTSPLVVALGTIDEDHGWIDGTIDPTPPTDGGWLSAAAIATSPVAVERLYDVARASTGPADERTIGAMMAQRVAEPGRLAGILYRRHGLVPMLPPETALLPYTDDRHSSVRLLDDAFACVVDDAASVHSAARRVADRDELRAVLVAEVRRNVAPTVAPIAERTHLHPRAVWALVAYGALVSIAEGLDADGDAGGALAELEALMAIGGPLADPAAEAHLEAADAGPRFILRMGACCRIYRWPDGRDKCAACPIRTPEERSALQADGEDHD